MSLSKVDLFCSVLLVQKMHKRTFFPIFLLTFPRWMSTLQIISHNLSQNPRHAKRLNELLENPCHFTVWKQIITIFIIILTTKTLIGKVEWPLFNIVLLQDFRLKEEKNILSYEERILFSLAFMMSRGVSLRKNHPSPKPHVSSLLYPCPSHRDISNRNCSTPFNSESLNALTNYGFHPFFPLQVL